MPALATRTYENITPEKWKAIQTAAALYGVNIEEDAGEANIFSAHVRWFRQEKKLKIEILQSSFLSVDHVANTLGRMVENA